MMSVEQSVVLLAKETELFGENLPQCLFFHHKSHMTCPGRQPMPPRWEASDYVPICIPQIPHDLIRDRIKASTLGSKRICNRPSYGTTFLE
jgi:hypothetical protein